MKQHALLSCDRSSRLGFIQENCACDGYAEDLGVRCPGLHSELFYNCNLFSLHKSFKFDEHYMYVPLAITDANECEIDPDINLR